MRIHNSRCNVSGDDVHLAAPPRPEAPNSTATCDVQVLSFVSDHKGDRIGFCDLALRLLGQQRLVIKRCPVHSRGSVWVTFPAEEIGPGKNGYRNVIQFPDPGDRMHFRAAVTLALAPFIGKSEVQ